MKLLAVETATSWQSVAIVDDDRVLGQQDQEAMGTQAKLLLPAIDQVLTQTGLRLNELDGLACSIGPGSFTGIRVGVATCLGLRAAAGLPLVLIPTLEAMAWNEKNSTGSICPIVTSRKGEVYWAIFRWTNDHLERIMAERAGAPQALAQSLTEPAMLLGNGWSSMEPEIRAALSPSISISVNPLARPSAVAVGMLGVEKLRRGEIAGMAVSPLYVQRPEAEVKYEQSGGLSPVVRRQERVARKTAERLSRGRPTPRRTRKSDAT